MQGPPTRIGNYELLLELASGGMATVYLARQVGAGGFERVVVLKRVHPHLLRDRSFHDMFRDEARIASLVRHPNVVPVIDVVEAESELLLVMDYVESSSLSTVRKAAHEAKTFIEPAVAVRMVIDALQGLHAAHEAKDLRGVPLDIVHRDVSPQNLIVSVDGSTRLIDFGVAKAQNRLTETRSGGVKGKYAYMSPEQVNGKEIDRRTDLFAAGIVLWETLTNERLFAGDNELDTMRRITQAPIPDPATINPQSPPALYQFLLHALHRDKNSRFATALDMVEALEHAVRPASHRAVAAAHEALCGDRLRQRRDALAAALAGDQDAQGSSVSRAMASSSWPQVAENRPSRSRVPTAPTAPASQSSSRSGSHSGSLPASQASWSSSRSGALPPGQPPAGTVSFAPSETASFAPPDPEAQHTLSVTPAPASSPSQRSSSSLARLLEPESGTVSVSASSVQPRPSQAPPAIDEDELALRPPSSRKKIAFAGVALALVGVAALALSSTSSPPKDPPPPSSGAPSLSPPPPPPPPASTSAPAVEEIALELSAEATIESVRVPGLLRAELAGLRAKVWVQPWAGSLAIDATLAGNKKATATATFTGPRQLTLTRGKKAADPGRRELQGSPY